MGHLGQRRVSSMPKKPPVTSHSKFLSQRQFDSSCTLRIRSPARSKQKYRSLWLSFPHRLRRSPQKPLETNIPQSKRAQKQILPPSPSSRGRPDVPPKG